MSVLLDIAAWLLIAAGWAAWLLPACRRRLDDSSTTADGLFALGNGCWTIEHALRGDWASMGISGACAGICVIAWWAGRRRRKRRRALEMLGAKSRALRDQLVRRVRETAIPRPVLRPVPQGAP